MSARFDCAEPAQRADGLAEATASLRKGELAVFPTDTVYGVGADAFSPAAVAALQAARGSGRHAPPAVLVGTVRAASALAEDFSQFAKDLIDEFWPGPLTLVCRASRTLSWDLGDAMGTVAIRMPLQVVALDLLKEVGPLAVSVASRAGGPPATTAAQAQAQLGDSVAVYLDGGPCPGRVPSTIVDLTGGVPRLLRRGAITVDRLRQVIVLTAEDETAGGETAGSQAAGSGEAGAGGTAGDATAAGGTAGDATAGEKTGADAAAADGEER